MGLPQTVEALTREEFIAWEDAQPDKHEFFAGEAFAMVGARRVHVSIAGNCFALLKGHLRGGPCRAFMADMKLEVKVADAVFYQDVLVTCHPDDLKAETVMHHPTVIIEVLSESTAALDRPLRSWRQIRQLPLARQSVRVRLDRSGSSSRRGVPAHGQRRLAARRQRERTGVAPEIAGFRRRARCGV